MIPRRYRAFVSSTYVDLKDHRAHVIRALRKAGIFVDPMDDWTADPQEPKQFSQDRVDGCDLCVLLVAFRRGFVAAGETSSITQLEYQHARNHGIDVLPFLLDDDAPWQRKFDETHTDAKVAAWRDELRESHGCGTFGLDPATIEIQPAISRWIAARPDQNKQKPVPTEPPSSDSVQHYLKRLADETQHLTLLGMGRSLQVELPIAEAYVPLRTTLARSWDEQETLRVRDSQADYDENVDLGEVFRKAAALKYRGVILLGEPGSGKTTGARQLAWRLASGQSLPKDLGLPEGITPVLLRFRNLDRKALAAKKNGLREFLHAETRCDEAPDELQAPGPELWNRRGGSLLWLLDGLDEIVDPGARKKVSGWVRKALANRPDDWFLVTCRFQGYFRDGVPLGPKFVEFHVRPLDDEQVDRFVRDWFAAAYANLLGPGEKAETRARQDSVELLDILTRPDNPAGHIRELVARSGVAVPQAITTVLRSFFRRDAESRNRRESPRPGGAMFGKSPLLCTHCP